MKPRFSRDRTFTMIHGIKAVIISKVQGRTKVEVVKCYDLRDYRMIPRIPANMRRDVERFWACLREGISDDEFIDEQYVKHGTCCKVRNRREYYNRCLDLGSEVVRQGSTDELMDVLRNGEEGGLIPAAATGAGKSSNTTLMGVLSLGSSVIFINLL